jgi:hypothetical protein
MTATTTRTMRAKPMAADAFMASMTAFVKTGQAAAAAAFFEAHAQVVLDHLTEAQRERLDAIMHYVDTVTGWLPPADHPATTVIPVGPPDDSLPAAP